MRTRPWLFFGLLLVLTPWAPAQNVRSAPLPLAQGSSAQLSAEQLDELLGPIALYPDALIAIMLPASTAPSEIVLAARYLQAGRNSQPIENQPWEDSVRALAHYPDTIRWMDENLAWTKQLGEIFLAQPDDAMTAIQRLRARALAAGHLFSNAQHQVVTEGGLISILPAQPHVIYAPYYSPQIVYFSRVGYSSFDAPFLSFGSGFSSGWWLAYHLDWGQRRIWVVDQQARQRHWQEHRDLRPGLPPPPGRPGYIGPPPWQTWRPSAPPPRPPRTVDVGHRTQIVIVQPAPYSGAPRFNRPPPPISPAHTRPEPRPRPSTEVPPVRPPGPDRSFARPSVPPVTTVTPPATVSIPPSRPTPPHRSRASTHSTPSPSPNPAPVSSTLTFSPAPAPAATVTSPSPPPASRPSETRADQPARNRPPRDDRPAPTAPRTTAESRGRPVPAPSPNPSAAAAPATPAAVPRAAPAPPAAPPAPTARPAPPAADADDRRSRKPDEQAR